MSYPLPNFSTDLTGQIALVTGASSGLGWRFAKVLAKSGAKVIVTGRRLERLEQLATEIRNDGGTAVPLAMDMSKSSEIAPALDKAEKALGQITILINNAGIPDAQRATKMSPELTDRVFDTNLRGPWILSCEFARRLMATKTPGRIVNIASMAAHVYSGSGAALYSLTKAGVVRMTEVLASEWAPFNINVNCISPGAFASEMMDGMIGRIGEGFTQAFPRKRLGDPAQLDSTLLYLVSPSSDFVTGTAIKVDDGQSSR